MGEPNCTYVWNASCCKVGHSDACLQYLGSSPMDPSTIHLFQKRKGTRPLLGQSPRHVHLVPIQRNMLWKNGWCHHFFFAVTSLFFFFLFPIDGWRGRRGPLWLDPLKFRAWAISFHKLDTWEEGDILNLAMATLSTPLTNWSEVIDILVRMIGIIKLKCLTRHMQCNLWLHLRYTSLHMLDSPVSYDFE